MRKNQNIISYYAPDDVLLWLDKQVNKSGAISEAIRKSIKTKPSKSDDPAIGDIYRHFTTAFSKNPNTYKLTDKRKQQIAIRLQDAGADLLKQAIDNTAQSAWHRGENDRGWVADLDFIIRSYEQVEKLANMGVKVKEIPRY